MLIRDRDASRRFFADVWVKHKKSELLAPLEGLVLAVIFEHPEYHAMLEDEETLLGEFDPGSGRENPFLHMGMHIAIREQVATDRPAGITSLYQSLSARHQDDHKLEHRMMECLGEALWRAQRSGGMPDDVTYLKCLRKLL